MQQYMLFEFAINQSKIYYMDFFENIIDKGVNLKANIFSTNLIEPARKIADAGESLNIS